MLVEKLNKLLLDCSDLSIVDAKIRFDGIAETIMVKNGKFIVKTKEMSHDQIIKLISNRNEWLKAEEGRTEKRKGDSDTLIKMLDVLKNRVPKKIREISFRFYAAKSSIKQWPIIELNKDNSKLARSAQYLLVLKNNRNLFKTAIGTYSIHKYGGKTKIHTYGQSKSNWGHPKNILDKLGKYPELAKLLSDPNVKW